MESSVWIAQRNLDCGVVLRFYLVLVEKSNMRMMLMNVDCAILSSINGSCFAY